MRQVLLALTPGIIIYTGFFGWGLLIQIALATTAAVIFEAIVLKLRHYPVTTYLGDYSALVTAWLLAICLPPLLPWWMTILAVFFAIVIAKHLYGGLGYNLFNPAMVGYVALLISFPREMTQWITPSSTDLPGFSQTLSIIFTHSEWIDGLSSATPLDHYKHNTTEAPHIMGTIAGKGWEWIALAWLIGGLWLTCKRVLDWRIPLSLLITVGLFALGISLYSDHPNWQSPGFQLLSGGVVLTAFFIATDPVTAATTSLGRWIYAAGIGCLAMIIRVWGGYPDGFAFAVLFMNLAAPTIDHFTVPRPDGHQ